MINEHHKGIVDRYVEQRLHAGSGFQSLIEGRPVIGRLDLSVRENLANILLYIEKAVPPEARGSRENYRNWCGEAETL